MKKLLEHKFFKAARDRQYIVDKIVRKMPVRKPPQQDAKLLNLCALRHPTLENGGGVDIGGLDAEKGRPVSVGSVSKQHSGEEQAAVRISPRCSLTSA